MHFQVVLVRLCKISLTLSCKNFSLSKSYTHSSLSGHLCPTEYRPNTACFFIHGFFASLV